MMAWEPLSAERASGRRRPWVSEMMPRRKGFICAPRLAQRLFDSALNKEPGYYRLRVSDLKLEKRVDFKKLRFFPGQFGGAPWTVLGPGDVPLFPRDISTPEIYAFDLRFP